MERPFVNIDILKNIYYSLLYSHLVYGIHVWGTACDTELNKILILQKRIVRLITLNDQLPINAGPLIHSDPLFAKLAFLKIKDIFILLIVKFIFNCLHLNIPANFMSWFKLNSFIHNYGTRSNFYDIDNMINSNNLFITFARTSHHGLKLIKVLGPKIWNKLPKDLRKLDSLNLFSKHIKYHLISQYTVL